MQRLRAIIACAALLILPASRVSAQVVGNDDARLPLASVDTRAAAIVPGAPPTLLQFTVDPSGGGDLFDVVSSHPQVAVSLILPGGAEINSANAAAQGFSFDVVTTNANDDPAMASNFDLPGTHTVIGLPPLSPSGTYQVKLDGSAVTTTEAVIATYYSASPIRAGAVTDAGTYQAGDTVVVSAILLDGVAPIAGATVNASVGDPLQAGAVPTQVVLQDSGQYDEATGDGIYTGTFTASQAGQFAVQVRATGTSAAGVSFSRTASTSFRVLPPLARLLSFSDAGVDDNGNSLIDRIVVTATVDVQAAGNYLFTMGLVSSSGVRINASTSAPLAAGTQQIAVPFPAADVSSLGADGPYQRRDATLYAVDDAEQTVTSFVGDAGLTAAYPRSSLERPAIQFTGNNTATGIDANGNGKFDILRIQAEVNVIAAGFYHWNGGLRDTSGKTIQLVANSASLTAGLNTIIFDFDGKKIAQNDKDGPFSLTSVMMYSPNASTVINELWETPAFAVGDFECSGVIPPPIQSATLTPTSVIGGNSSRLRVNFTEPAGACGAKIFLSSDHPAAIAAVIPTDVVVAAGQNFAEVTVITSGVAAATPVVLTVTSGATSQSVTLNVTPAALTTLTVLPATASAGVGVTGKVTLDGAAPAGGSVVALTSSDPVNAPVPASVTIAGGTRDATFIINTNAALEGTASATISASSAGVTKSAPLTIYSEVFIAGTIVAGGPPVTVTATQPGQNFLLAFEGAQGQRVSLRLTDVSIGTSSCCSSNVAIKKPDGSFLVPARQVGTSGAFIDATTLPAAGTYTVVVDPVGVATGSMTLTLYDVPPDITGTITPGGPPVTVDITGPGQKAQLTFDGAQGQRVSLKVTGTTISQGQLHISKPDGTQLTNPTSFATGSLFINTLTLPAAGTYAILVDPSSYHTGSMTLTLYDVPADIFGTITAGGPPVTVTTTTPGQKAQLTFDGAANQRVSLKISGVAMSGNGYVDVSMRKPDGTNLASATFVSSGGDFIDTQALAAGGTYTILISPVSSNTGSVTLTLYDVPPDPTGTITAGGPPVSVSTSVPGQNALLTFSGAAGQRVTLNIGSVAMAGGNGYVDVSIKKPDGTNLASATYVNSGGGFINTQTLPAAGTYTILVNPQGSNTGSLSLTLNDVSADVISALTPGGSSVTVTTTSVGQNALVTFDGVAGQRVSLKISGVAMAGGNGYVDVSIKKPDGSTLVSSTYINSSGGFIDTRTLPVTGTYTILVDPQTTNTGSVTLTLYDVPPDVTGTLTPGGPPLTVTTTTPGQNAQPTINATTGQRVYLKVTGVALSGGANNWANVLIKRPDGTTQVSDTFSSSGGFIDTQTLALDGAYTVLVDPWTTSTGSATLTLYDVPADITGTITPGGSASTVTTTAIGQNVRLTFDGTANQRVSLKITGVTLSGGSQSWANIYIKKPDGTNLTSTTVDTAGGYIDTKTLPVTGTYTILVDPLNTTTGSMTLTLYDVPADITGPITPGGSPVTVTTTTPGQNASLTFDGAANQRVSLNVSGVSMTGNTWVNVWIKKPDGTNLTSDTFSSSGGYIDAKTLPVAGTYTVLVDPYNSNTGSATVTLYDVPADAAASTTINADAVGVTATVPGQNARVTFDATSGQQVTVRITNNTVGTVTVKLLRPDGTQQTTASSSASSFNLTAQTLTSTGTFTVSIDPSGSRTGSMSVRVTSP